MEKTMEFLKRTENWNITYEHALGETASWFYTKIRDDAEIYGRRCPESGRVLVPPRAFSDQTLAPTTDWVKVGPEGVIETFTIVRSEEHTSELQSLMRISYAVFCLKKIKYILTTTISDICTPNTHLNVRHIMHVNTPHFTY